MHVGLSALGLNLIRCTVYERHLSQSPSERTRKMSLTTAFTKLFASASYRYGLRTTIPIVCPPMAAASGGRLAGATSAAGGLGMIGAGYYTVDKLTTEIQEAKDEMQSQLRRAGASGAAPSSSSSDETSALLLGVGFLVWKLTAMNDGKLPDTSDPPSKSQAHGMLDLIARERIAALWLSFGERADTEAWLRYVRAREEAAGTGSKMKLFIGIGNIEQAKEAVEQFHPDVLAVTGGEAGGHGLAASPPLPVLLPQVLRYLSSSKESNAPILLGAGGLSDGTSLAATLALGAQGGIFGTRYLLTPQAHFTDAQKKILVENSGETLRTMAFDEARGTTGWPAGVDGRGIYNDTVADYEKGLGDEQSRRNTYDEAAKKGDEKRIVTWAGTGVGNMNEILDAADLTRQLGEETRRAIERLQGFL